MDLLKHLRCLALVLISPFAVGETLSQIYEQAVEHDPQLRAAQAAYRAGSEAKNIGRAGLLPQITARGEYEELESDGANTTVLGQGAVLVGELCA